MSPTTKKALLATGGLLGAGVFAAVAMIGWYYVSWPGSFPDTPYPDITASTDPAVIARGEYLFEAVAHCTICHTKEQDFFGNPDVSGMVPSGDHVWELGPLGVFRSANLTSDPETGIGKLTDADIARVVTTGIGADHEPAPLMASIGPMADEDLTAIVSYVRSIPPVKNEVPPTEVGVAGRVMIPLLMGGFVQPKVGWKAPPFVKEGGISAERGRYLAEGPAFCYGCHSEMQLAPTLELLPPYLAGSTAANPDPVDETMEIIAPNLTRHETGVLSYMDEDAFVSRLRSGRAVAHSPMPWENYRLMTEDDLRSIYRHLAAQEPVDRLTGPGYRKAGWTPPE